MWRRPKGNFTCRCLPAYIGFFTERKDRLGPGLGFLVRAKVRQNSQMTPALSKDSDQAVLSLCWTLRSFYRFAYEDAYISEILTLKRVAKLYN